MPLTANAQGEVMGKFTIPAHVPAGTKKVEFLGATCRGSATFVGRGQVTNLTKRLTLTTHVQNIIGYNYSRPGTPPSAEESSRTKWSWWWEAPCKAYYEASLGLKDLHISVGEVRTQEQYERICFPTAGGAWYPWERSALDMEHPWPSVGGGWQVPYPGYSPSSSVRYHPDSPYYEKKDKVAFDPLAQTIFLDYAAQITAIELWFTAKGLGRQNILVQIREALNGVPTDTVLGQRMLTPAEITLNAWTRFNFPPVMIAANQEYAIVIGAEDTVSAVAIATLGEYDEAVAQWVTTQPYQVGIMLSSSNNLSWTPHQTQDLTFRVLAQTYHSEVDTAPSRTIALPAVEVTDADQLLVLATVERPNSQCNVVFNLTAGGKTYQCVDHQVVTLDSRYTGTITWEAVLTGTTHVSPLLYKDIQLIAGERLSSSNYISAALDTKVSPTKLTVNMDVYVDCYLPSPATLAATAQIGAAWEALELLETEALGEGWYEHHYRLEDIAETQTRLQLELTGSAVKRPRLRNLRVALT